MKQNTNLFPQKHQIYQININFYLECSEKSINFRRKNTNTDLVYSILYPVKTIQNFALKIQKKMYFSTVFVRTIWSLESTSLTEY